MAKTILSGTWTLGDCNSMPWDEAKECPTRALQEELDVFCSSDGSVSDEWRRIGKARRKLLLDEDRRNGGTHFDLNKNCNVDRYFEVAHRVSSLVDLVHVDLAGGWSKQLIARFSLSL